MNQFDESFLIDELYPDCPILNVLSRITDKWSMLVLYTLSRHECLRFNELQRAIPNVSSKMLSSTLRILEQDGYVLRTVYPEVPPRVEYRLTERAHSLLPHIFQLLQWAKTHFADILHDRQLYVQRR